MAMLLQWPGTERIPFGLLIGSWLLFVTFWLLMAFTTKRMARAEPLMTRLRYWPPTFIGICMIARVPRHGRIADLLYRPLGHGGPGLHWAGAGLAVAGVALAIWARVTLGRNWSGQVTLRQDHALVTSGPYALVRHPIYTAILLMLAGIVLFSAAPGALIGLALVLTSFWIKLRAEEELMLQTFPGTYPAYMARTKRLVPGLV